MSDVEAAAQQRRMLLALKALRARVEELEGAENEPIAIVGLGCRFPEAPSPPAFWSLLERGGDGVREIPPERLALWSSIEPSVVQPNAVTSLRGGFLRDPIDQFDHRFFQISPREAASMDPQQRLLLEVSWEALEDAFIPPKSLFDSAGGVFVGMMTDDFTELELRSGDRLGSYSFTGSTTSVAAGRLSYFYGLHGPAMTIDTACSSSLVAVHLACQSLRVRECNVALACGVSLMLSPHVTMAMSRVGALSPDGRCWTFDARANGYVRGEGCGVVVLERLSDAIANGHDVRAVILASAVNHDGRSSGLTAPNGSAQQALLRQALTAAGVEPAEVGYLEAHGTGTPLGDPIELSAAVSVFGENDRTGGPLLVGSAKANFGHLDSAAGIAGLIKATLALEHRTIPPHPTFERLNPKIVMAEGAVTIPRVPTPWESAGRRIAGVNAFGISGTNAHALLAEAPEQDPAAEPASYRRDVPLLVSGLGPAAIAPQLEAWTRVGEDALDDARVLAAVGRTHLPHRVAIALPKLGANEVLTAALHGKRDGVNIFEGTAASIPRIAFVFSGQGSHWRGMARGLLSDPAFRAELDRCDAVVRQVANWSLIEQLESGLSDLMVAKTELAQPLLVAYQIAVASMLVSWGIQPVAVTGHSVGEIAAAHVAGVFTLEQAMELAVMRGQVMASAFDQGRMASVDESPEIAERLAAELGDVDLAAVNGPANRVFAGTPARIETLIREAGARGMRAKELPVRYAFHSRQMAPFAKELHNALRHLKPSECQVTFVSTLTGTEERGERLDAAYWADEVRSPVRFLEATRELLQKGADVLLEISPHPVLGAGMAETISASNSAAFVERTFRRDEDDARALLRLVAALHVRGAEIDYRAYAGHRPGRVTVPGYAWQRERSWPATPRAHAGRATLGAHPLLAHEVTLARPRTHVWESHVEIGDHPLLAEHIVDGSPWMPAAAWIDTAFAAAKLSKLGVDLELANLDLVEPLILDQAVTVQVVLEVTDLGGRLTFASRRAGATGPWTIHASGELQRQAETKESSDVVGARERCKDRWTGDEFYQRAAEQGLVYEGTFRRVASVARRDKEALAELTADGDEAAWDPAVLDALLQVSIATSVEPTPVHTARVPISIDRIAVRGSLRQPLQVHARAEGDGSRLEIVARASDGAVVAIVGGLTVKRVSTERKTPRAPECYEVLWEELPPAFEQKAQGTGRWLVVDPRSGMGEEVAQGLTKRGVEVKVISEAGTLDGELNGFLGSSNATGVIVLCDGDGTMARHAAFATARRLAVSSEDRTPLRLIFVTRGARRAIDDDRIEPKSTVHAAAWGLMATIAEEIPNLKARVIDVDDAASPAVASLILAPEAEARLALRAGRVYGERLAPYTPPSSNAVAMRDGTVLVTGGLGALGRQVVAWLVQRGARSIAVVGRSASPTASEVVALGEQAGVKISVHRADVSKRDEVERVIGEIERGGGPLCGVVHCAGVLDDGTLPNLTAERVDAVFAAKALAATHLDALTRQRPLDFFVLFSSMAGSLGAVAQANYAAANAVLDAIASSRQAAGLPGVSIPWGRWAGPGMAADEAVAASLEARGIRAIDPKGAFDALEGVMMTRKAVVMIASVDWARWRIVHPHLGRSPLLARLPGAIIETRRLPGDELRELSPERRKAWLGDYVARTTGDLLRISPEEIDRDRPLGEYGFDSMMTVTLRGRLEAELGVSISTSQLYAEGAVSRVAQLLEKKTKAAVQSRPPSKSSHAEGNDADSELAREIAVLRERGFR